jgi:hypothetical protein
MSTSNPTINLDARRQVSIALLMAIILSLMSILRGGSSIIAPYIIGVAVGDVGGIILPVEGVVTPVMGTFFLLTIMVAVAVALMAFIFDGWK